VEGQTIARTSTVKLKICRGEEKRTHIQTTSTSQENAIAFAAQQQQQKDLPEMLQNSSQVMCIYNTAPSQIKKCRQILSGVCWRQGIANIQRLVLHFNNCNYSIVSRYFGMPLFWGI